MVKEEGLIIDGEVYKAQEFKPNICTVTAKKGIDFERIKEYTRYKYGKVSIKFKLDPEDDKDVIEWFEIVIYEPRFDWRLWYNWFNQQYPNLRVKGESEIDCCLWCIWCNPEGCKCFRWGEYQYLGVWVTKLVCDNYNKDS